MGSGVVLQDLLNVHVDITESRQALRDSRRFVGQQGHALLHRERFADRLRHSKGETFQWSD